MITPNQVVEVGCLSYEQVDLPLPQSPQVNQTRLSVPALDLLVLQSHGRVLHERPQYGHDQAGHHLCGPGLQTSYFRC